MSRPRPVTRMHLVRHGEVVNPRHVVYADLPGYGLSTRGREQAAAAAAHLAAEPVTAVLTSPLERAQATAEVIANRHGLEATVDERLTEWRMSRGWAGVVWEELATVRPGELEAYLMTPDTLGFSEESLDQMADRMVEVMRATSSPGSAVVLVSHQDPVQAARRRATGGSFSHFHEAKPGHASVTTLESTSEPGRFREVGYWEPDQGHAFPPVSDR